MRNHLIILFSFIAAVSFSQSFSSHPIAITPTVFPDNKFDEEQFRKKLYAQLEIEPDKNLLSEYASLSIADKKYFYNSNEIYDNWPEATDFVKKVFQKAIPSGFSTKDIKIFVVRSPDFNAYCMEDGNITVTTGFLAFMNNEAELAITLSHEYGHFYCHHNFHGFKEKQKAVQKRSKSIFVNKHTGYGDYFSHLRDAERTADTFEINFVQKNGYAPESIVSNFENFDKVSLKYQSLRGYRKQPAYFSTHPSSSERLQKAKDFAVQNKIKGKIFQVDSLEFLRVKKRAVDECIYLLYEQLRFDECLELAFFQHLYYPADEFYLYFILESLKSNTASDQFYGRYPFITAYYDPKKLNKQSFNRFCLNPTFNSYEQADFKFSVLNNLQSPIFSLNNKQLGEIKAIDFLKKDTIPFYTNKEAMVYFAKKIPKSSTVFNSMRLKLELPVEAECQGGADKSKLENDLCEIYDNLKNYHSKWDSLDYGMVVLHDVNFYDYTGGSLVYFTDLDREKELYSQYRNFGKANKFMWIINEDVLNFRERSKIKHIANFNESMVANSLFGKSADIDFLQVCPELVMQSMKNKVETIFIVSLYLYSVEHSVAYIYGVDIRNRRISLHKLPLNCSYTAAPEVIFKKVFSECESRIKN